MAYLFTPRHRERYVKSSDHELFHGHYAEKMYMAGMLLSAERNELVKAIRYKRCSIATLRKNARKNDPNNLRYWEEVSAIRHDDRPLDFVRGRLATVVNELRIVSLNYQIAFLVSRGRSQKEIANVIRWYSSRFDVDCGDPDMAARIAIEKIKTMEQLQRCGMKLNMDRVNAIARIESLQEVVLDIEVEKTSPIDAKFVMTARKSEGEK